VKVVAIRLSEAGHIQIAFACLVDDTTVDQNGGSVAELQSSFQVVGGHQHGARSPTQGHQHFSQHLRRLLIQAGVRLIQQQDGGVVQEGPGNGQALLHAPGESAHQIVAAMLQPHALEESRDALLQFAHLVHTSVEAQVLLG